MVGAADAASPTGELDGSLRALEVAMIREALDDAGLVVSDAPYDVAVGTRVRVGWEELSDGRALPVFEPAS